MKYLHQLYFTSPLVFPCPCFSATSSTFKRKLSSPEMKKTDIPLLAPSALSPLFFFQTKSAEMRQNFSTCAQTTQSWQIPTKCTQMDVTASQEIQDNIAKMPAEMLLQLRYCIGNTKMCLFSSFLVESPE